MKKYILIILILLMSFLLLKCEKDDICSGDTLTSPRLIIEFYDYNNPTELSQITYLGIADPTFVSGYSFNSLSRIAIPLRSNQDTTTLNFVLNGSDDDTTNDVLDTVTFNYTRKNTYISRACGYKTTYVLNDTDGLVVPTTNWIKSIEIIDSNIENENETHVKIYF
ncbi:DUF6452 family protein [uncultured Flavobacterium sp.]|uniref:DUF6452 family protein n=1 Tax=uncultured Flavobacterium sp. TaxID=165435 RepID=UPI0030CA2381